MTNPATVLDIHTYDGKINIDQLPNIADVANLTFDQKKNRGKELLLTAINFDRTAYLFLEQIILQIGTPMNIDPTNKIIADDLICLCWLYKENKEFMSILETQLMDMNTGFCSQGRTHRLFQTLLAFIDC